MKIREWMGGRKNDRKLNFVEMMMIVELLIVNIEMVIEEGNLKELR